LVGRSASGELVRSGLQLAVVHGRHHESGVTAIVFDLTLVVLGIRLVREELGVRLEADSRLQIRYLEGDTSVADEATTAACSRLGIRVEDYRRVVDSAPSLVWLETESIREALVGSTDPGPYDRISPTSPVPVPS
jgi:hypothetical protein